MNGTRLRCILVAPGGRTGSAPADRKRRSLSVVLSPKERD